MITNSTIIDPRPVPKLRYGVNNSAQEQVVVNNLSVIGAVTPWSHCYEAVETIETPSEVSILNGTTHIFKRFAEIIIRTNLRDEFFNEVT